MLKDTFSVTKLCLHVHFAYCFIDPSVVLFDLVILSMDYSFPLQDKRAVLQQTKAYS